MSGSRLDYLFDAHGLRKALEKIVEQDYGRSLSFDDCIAGKRSGGAIIAQAPNELRGHLVKWAYWLVRAGRSNVNLLRDALDAAWSLDHDCVITSINNRAVLEAIFRCAQFAAPAGLPPVINIWRGVSGVPLETARRGLSWTTHRDVACWFAMRFSTAEEPSLVIKANVAAAKVFHLPGGRGENEVVCFRAVGATVDGDLPDWRRAADRWQSEIAAAQKAALADRLSRWAEPSVPTPMPAGSVSATSVEM